MHARVHDFALADTEILVRLRSHILAVEDLGHLLEGQILGLDVEIPNDDDLKHQEHAVEDVVLPVQVVHGDRVDVLVEEQRSVQRVLHDCEALGA